MRAHDYADLQVLVPEDLAGLPDDQFRRVVDADLRRRTDPSTLSDDLAEALRSAKLAERWRMALQTILRSVEGQLAARKAHAEMLRLQSDEGGAWRQEQADYLRWLGGTERFRAGVLERLAEADYWCNTHRHAAGSGGGSERVRVLEDAIRTHRSTVLATEDEDKMFEADHTLWAVLEEP